MKYIVFFVLVFFLIGTLVIPQSLAQGIVPAWIKNSAGWWADDKISEGEFVNAISYLIKIGIILLHYYLEVGEDSLIKEVELRIMNFALVRHHILIILLDGKILD